MIPYPLINTFIMPAKHHDIAKGSQVICHTLGKTFPIRGQVKNFIVVPF